MTEVVRTVLGDVPATTLGVTYMHEHLIIDSPLVVDRYPHISLASVEETAAEVQICRDAGVSTMVDLMPAAAGRNIAKLTAVSRHTGMHVVASTGLHTAKYYAASPWTQLEGEDVLADFFTADVVEGVDRYDYTAPVVRRTDARAGVVKVATAAERPTATERRAFAAAAETHRRTGVAVLTHCEAGAGAGAQVELLRDLGVPLARVVLSHTDKVPDPAYHADLLASGVNLEYDQALRQVHDEPPATAVLLAKMLELGHGGQLMLGTDGARRSLWRTLGGSPGLAYLTTGFFAVLRDHGVDEAALTAMTVTNPARVLTLRPPTRLGDHP